MVDGRWCPAASQVTASKIAPASAKYPRPDPNLAKSSSARLSLVCIAAKGCRQSVAKFAACVAIRRTERGQFALLWMGISSATATWRSNAGARECNGRPPSHMYCRDEFMAHGGHFQEDLGGSAQDMNGLGSWSKSRTHAQERRQQPRPTDPSLTSILNAATPALFSPIFKCTIAVSSAAGRVSNPL